MPNMRVKQAILEVVENQVRANNPPDTRRTLARLQAAGYSRRQALEMIGSVLVAEIWHIQKNQEMFNPARYRAGLDALE